MLGSNIVLFDKEVTSDSDEGFESDSEEEIFEVFQLSSSRALSIGCQFSQLIEMHMLDVEEMCRMNAEILCPVKTKLEELWASTKNSVFAGTVTIGNIRFGCMNDRDQVEKIIESYNRVYTKKKTKSQYYFVVFEYQRNGQIHAHTVEYNVYPATWINEFKKYGSRNSDKHSYKPISDFEAYWTYITKNSRKANTKYNPWYRFPPITNIGANKIN